MRTNSGHFLVADLDTDHLPQDVSQLLSQLSPKTLTPTIAYDREFVDRFLQANSEEKTAMVLTYVENKTIKMLGASAQVNDLSLPLTDIGFDSLMAMELNKIVGRELGINVPMQSMLGGYGVSDIADTIQQQLLSTGVAKSAKKQPSESTDWDEGVL